MIRALLVLAASPAFAESKPDPAAAQAGEANLESTAERRGLVFTFAGGAGVTISTGVNDSTGTGGSGSLRIAHVATPRSLVTLELTGNGLLHQVQEGMGDNAETKTYVNQVNTFMVGGQLYVNPALWFRGAGGIGRYFGDNVTFESPSGQPRRGDMRLAGPVVGGGAGLDFVRLKRVRLGVEIVAMSMLTRDGVLTSGGFLFAVSVD